MMKSVSYSVCVVILLVGSTIAAHAQTAEDPKTIINTPTMPGGDPPCGGPGEPICITVNNSSHPLVEPYSPTYAADFEYCPPASSNCTVSGVTSPLLTKFYLEFTEVPLGTEFGCQTNIWVDCGVGVVAVDPDGKLTFEFTLSGGYGAVPPMNCNFNDGVGGTCPGFLAPGAAVDITNMPLISEIPEPGSIILFGTGLLSFFMTAKRRLQI